MVSAVGSFSSTLVPFMNRSAITGVSPVARKTGSAPEINSDTVSSLAFTQNSSQSSSNSIVERLIDTALVTADSLFAAQQMAGMSVLSVDASSSSYEQYVSDNSFSAMDNYQQILDENAGDVDLIEEYADRVIERNRERRSSSRDDMLNRSRQQQASQNNAEYNVDDAVSQDVASYDEQYTVSNVETDAEVAQQKTTDNAQQYQTQVQFNNSDIVSTVSASNVDFSSFVNSAINSYSKVNSVSSPNSSVTFYSSEKSFDFAV